MRNNEEIDQFLLSARDGSLHTQPGCGCAYSRDDTDGNVHMERNCGMQP